MSLIHLREGRLNVALTNLLFSAINYYLYSLSKMDFMTIFCFYDTVVFFQNIYYYVGYTTLWLSLTYLSYEDFQFQSFLRTIAYFSLNMTSAYYLQNVWFWALNFFSYFLFQMHIDSYQLAITGVLNLFGLLPMVCSIGFKLLMQNPSIFPVLLELSAMVGVHISLFSFSSTLNIFSIFACYLTGLISSILSSFPTPLNGYPFLITTLSSFGAAWLIIFKRRQTIKKSSMGLNVKATLGRIGSVLGGCFLMRISPYFENVALYWIGFVSVMFLIGNLLRKKTLLDILSGVVLCLPLIIVGVMLQSKLVVVIGCICIFVGINILASTIFPTSVLFPFILTISGFCFIYAGTVFDNDSIMEMFKYQHESTGVIEGLTLDAVKYVGNYLNIKK